MRARCSLVVNGRAVRCSTGDTPLEAALAEGMIAPVPGLHGVNLLGQGAGPAARRSQGRRGREAPAPLPDVPESRPAEHAPARAPQERPRQATLKGTLTEVRRLGPGILEVVATLTRRPLHEPGQQFTVTLPGLPPMALSPTLRVDGAAEINEAVFHLPRDPDGDGTDTLAPGGEVRLKGPTGRSHYRPGGGRLVLAATGAGFGPIWAIARAARYIEPERDMALSIGAPDALDLYMRESLDWLRATGVGRIVLCAERGRQRPPDVRPGPVGAHLPQLRASDVIHVAGDIGTVGAVQALAGAVGARCYPIVVG
ncbi:ferredoxin--NAD(+) reductase [Methylobacterium sp. J-076]|uniref:ferredoxin--NAD(+) reductase n=1 Tax=Methylobacterium sp. J-076 TaxID=2836655 RepID=UPI001FB9C56C|nr:ferredoxin--NAD(+) reductase [Methylobacterium sp. J-076]MCJ2012574.1 ferredoxin--NAD(+) reductase [Methylobacterium sp. J-076]